MFTPNGKIIARSGLLPKNPINADRFREPPRWPVRPKGMKRILALLVAVNSLAFGQGYWQPDYRKHHVTVGLGAAIPGGDLKQNYQKAFAWSVAYGYRPIKWLQADFGYDGAYNAADVNDYQYSGYGPLRITDYQTFLPVGGRVVLPVARGRVEFYGGGGGVYARYSESLRQPDEYTRLGCPSCKSRDGWGYYAMVGGSVAVDRGQRFRLGAATRMYQVDTAGATVGVLPSWKTADRWLNSYLTFTVSF